MVSDDVEAGVRVGSCGGVAVRVGSLVAKLVAGIGEDTAGGAAAGSVVGGAAGGCGDGDPAARRASNAAIPDWAGAAGGADTGGALMTGGALTALGNVFEAGTGRRFGRLPFVPLPVPLVLFAAVALLTALARLRAEALLR